VALSWQRCNADHDIVATIEDQDGPTFTLDLDGRPMALKRVEVKGFSCPAPVNTQTGIMDGGPVYGTDLQHEFKTLKMPNSCRLRESVPGFLPITTKADNKGRFFFLAGDLRVDEHAS
jgi:hypothetical protein